MRQQHKKIGLLLILAVLFAAGFAMATSATELKTASAKADPDKIGKAILSVSGMTCGGCISTINSALSAFQGIADTQVDIPGGKVDILYHIDQIDDLNKMAAAITAAGYPATIVQTIDPETLQQQQRQIEAKSKSVIATVGNQEISREDFDTELTHAGNRYKSIYGENIFSDQRGQQLHDNLKAQIAFKLVNEAIQLQEINRSGFNVDADTVEKQYRQFLDQRALSSTQFEAELEKTGYTPDYFKRKFADRVRIDTYLEEKVFQGTTTEMEKKKQYSQWFANAQVLATVQYHDQELERLVQSSSSGKGCGNKCSAKR